MYEIIFSSKALGQLESLDKSIRERILATLQRLRFRPETFVKRLAGQSSYSLRVGDYRIIMDINRGKLLILVIKVGHRRNVYK